MIDLSFPAETHVDVQLRHATIITLRATPATLLAGRPGILVAPIFAYFLADTTAGAYTIPVGAVLAVVGPFGHFVGCDPTGLMDNGDREFKYTVAWPEGLAGFGSSQGTMSPGAAIQLSLLGAAAEFGAGNAANTLSIRVFYRIVPNVPFTS